jgi:hypothetical protein
LRGILRAVWHCDYSEDTFHFIGIDMKKIIAASVLFVAAGAAYLPTMAHAQVGVSITLGSAPPPARYEVAPPPRRGFVWVPGYWDWNGNQYFWIGGHWERVRPGYVYANPVWVQGPGGWHLERGGWHNGPRGPHGRPPHQHFDHGRGPDRDHDRGHGPR